MVFHACVHLALLLALSLSRGIDEDGIQMREVAVGRNPAIANRL